MQCPFDKAISISEVEETTRDPLFHAHLRIRTLVGRVALPTLLLTWAHNKQLFIDYDNSRIY